MRAAQLFLREALRGGQLQRRIAALNMVPPLEFPCRIEALPEGCSTIDNSLYNSKQYVQSWHSADTSKELATLGLLNAARIPYFDRVWRQQLDLSPERPGACACNGRRHGRLGSGRNVERGGGRSRRRTPQGKMRAGGKKCSRSRQKRCRVPTTTLSSFAL